MSVQSTGEGIGLAIICLVLLGMMPVISNSRPEGVSALNFAVALSLWQLIVAAPVFGLELSSGEKGIFSLAIGRAERRRLIQIGLMTGAMFGLSTYLYVLGAEKAGAANAAIAIQAYPVLAILWEFLFLGRRKSTVELLLTLALIVTLFFLGTGGTMRLSGMSYWFLISLGVPLLWSIAHVIIRQELGRTSITPIQVTFFRVTVSTAFLVVLLVVTAPQSAFSELGRVVMQPTAVMMGVVYYLELIVWFYAIRHIDVSLASSITTPWPALTMVLAVFFLGDRIEPYQIVALSVMVVCIYGLILAGMRKERGASKAIAGLGGDR